MRAIAHASLVVLVALVACPAPHKHAPPAHPEDTRRLYVELSLAGSHKGSLADGARAGLAKVPFVVVLPPEEGGDVELQLQVARLDIEGKETVCGIKVLAVRLPQHDLFGMAEGSARAGGTHDQAGRDCIARLGESLIGGKVREILHKRLDEKR
jgi:hypothetical protein